MRRSLSLALWVALSVVLSGSQCDEYEPVPPQVWQQDVEPPFDYALYCDAQGKLQGERSAVLLVHRSSHLERVYEDSLRGDARAQALFGQLEQTVVATGEKLAARAVGLVCSSAPACTTRFAFLEELMPSRGEGGMRLRQKLADSFSLLPRTLVDGDLYRLVDGHQGE